MKDSVSFHLRACVVALIGTCAAGAAVPGTSTPVAEQPAVEGDVIVILRDQVASVPPARQAMGARASAVAAAHSAVVTGLQRQRPRSVRSFGTINAFATNVSASEAAQLALDPSVQAVVPDRVLHLPRREKSAATSSAAPSSASGSSSALCGTLEPEALQLTNTAFLNPSTPQAQGLLDGRGQPVNGRGVKVAIIADGLDTSLPGFIRPDGSHVFIDYQNFSGDPAGTATGGEEAFGDASSIAAQDHPYGKLLTFDISKFVNAAHKLPSPCTIQIRGMAPGASLVGLDVFSTLGYTTTSTFVQAIEYAVVHDDVDVINESFGGNPFPDQANDPISLANAAAVAAGTVVTVSTGDAGTAGTLGSPGTDPNVIAAGASTQFRLYAQTAYGAQPFAKGWLSNNISALSSGGFAQLHARTVDVVAPGDLGWALCSSNVAQFTDCIDFETQPKPTPVIDFGGTSEAAPLVAGEAALVIQAYRSTHGGRSPSPALVKQIIMSTAADLSVPSSEQGAGLIDSLAAVNVALYLGGNGRTPQPHAPGLFTSATGISVTAGGNSRQSQVVKITNTGSRARQLTPALQTLGAPLAGATTNVNLAPTSDPTFVNVTGALRTYVKRTFQVPEGMQHLDAEIAYQVPLNSTATPIVYLSLLDPAGRQVAYNLPQGLASGYGHVDVGNPAGGKWTAIIWTRPPGVGSYAGPVQFTWSAENFVNVGKVYPATLNLAPGATQSVTADFFMPTEPGDLAAAIRFDEEGAGDAGSEGASRLPEIPVSLRTLIATGPTGGSFTGTLTGGNGRPGAGPTQTFEFDVPAGLNDMSLALEIPDNGYLLEGLLVDPQGMQLSVAPNIDPTGAVQYGLQLFRESPQAGRWKFILLQNFTSSGNQTSLPFTARIGFNSAHIIANGLPNSANATVSASGKPLTATITVVNTGNQTLAYFADARLHTPSVNALTPQPCVKVTTLPGTCGLFYVPTQVSEVQFVAKSIVPIDMDAYNVAGYNVGGTFSPDLFARKIATNTVMATLSEPEIPYGQWVVAPALIGPYGAGGAPTEPVTTAAYALMLPFDTAVAADSGDIWADVTLGTNTYNPLVLASGQTGAITITIAPNAAQTGHTYSGFLFVDTFNGNVITGDEVVRIPYRYTVVK